MANQEMGKPCLLNTILEQMKVEDAKPRQLYHIEVFLADNLVAEAEILGPSSSAVTWMLCNNSKSKELILFEPSSTVEVRVNKSEEIFQGKHEGIILDLLENDTILDLFDKKGILKAQMRIGLFQITPTVTKVFLVPVMSLAYGMSKIYQWLGRIDDERIEHHVLVCRFIEGFVWQGGLCLKTSITFLDNETTVHPSMPSSPHTVIMNGHVDPKNDITNTPIPSRPLTPNLSHQSSIPLPATSNSNPPVLISQESTPLLSQIPLPSASGATDNNEDSDAEAETENGAGASATPGKRKARRGKRGKKKPSVLGAGDVGNGVNESDEKDKPEEGKVASKDREGGEKPPSLILTTSLPKPLAPLTVSDTILGYGSHGTVVYHGSFQGRAVAVKRILQDFATLATHEVSILQQSDDHPNVIRYHYQESHRNFFYIAMELCPASLADIIENPHDGNGGLSGGGRREEWNEIRRRFDAKRAMRQITSGLRHLHGLGLIHRDIKPQNILISSSSPSSSGTGYRMLISDFGLCKKLDLDQTSFLPTVNGATGTVGWRAPEILRGDVKLDELSTGDDSTSSRGSVATVIQVNSSYSGTTTKLTKNVDIFALGCLFYYILTTGGHPYGDRFEREVNITKNNKQLSLLSKFCSTEETTEAQDLISSMLHPQPPQRPDTKTCLLHPLFWDPAKRLGFLQDASDKFEVMCRDPKDAVLVRLEKDAGSVVGNDWHQALDRIVNENLRKYRTYDGKSVQDLMRALRNKKHHYQDLPDDVKQLLGPIPEGFLGHFTCRYPRLFMHVYGVVKDTELHV